MTEKTIICPICGHGFCDDECECGTLQYIERIAELRAGRDELREALILVQNEAALSESPLSSKVLQRISMTLAGKVD